MPRGWLRVLVFFPARPPCGPRGLGDVAGLPGVRSGGRWSVARYCKVAGYALTLGAWFAHSSRNACVKQFPGIGKEVGPEGGTPLGRPSGEVRPSSPGLLEEAGASGSPQSFSACTAGGIRQRPAMKLGIAAENR